MTRQVLVTGVGFKGEVDHNDTSSVFGNAKIKPNMGACIARRLAAIGYRTIISSRTITKIQRIKMSILQEFPHAVIDCITADMMQVESVRALESAIPTFPDLDIVQCAGASAGSFHAPGDNLFFRIQDTPTDMPAMEFDGVVRPLLLLVQLFLERLRRQNSSRLVVVTSMSGIRAVPYGFSHCAGKAGLHQAVRSLAIELNQLGIRVCEIAPGIVNTGLYDSPEVEGVVRLMGDAYDYHYPAGHLPQMSPHAVADAVALCLTSDAHILSVSMVADGQFPHMGA